MLCAYTTEREVRFDFVNVSIALLQTQALAEKQSAYYSAQRQLKMCRQTLESKELYVGLLQKKVASLEERVQELSHRETQLETTAGKVRL